MVSTIPAPLHADTLTVTVTVTVTAIAPPPVAVPSVAVPPVVVLKAAPPAATAVLKHVLVTVFIYGIILPKRAANMANGRLNISSPQNTQLVPTHADPAQRF